MSPILITLLFIPAGAALGSVFHSVYQYLKEKLTRPLCPSCKVPPVTEGSAPEPMTVSEAEALKKSKQ